MKRRRKWPILLIVAPILIGATLTGWSILRERLERGPYRPIELETLSNFLLNEQSGTEADIPQDVRELNGAHVCVTGFMWNLRSEFGRQQFQLVAQLRFDEHRMPRVQDRVFVHTAPGSHVHYIDGTARVRGVLHVRIWHDNFGTIRSVFTLTDPSIDVAPLPTGARPRSLLTAAWGRGALVSIVFTIASIAPSLLLRLEEWFHQRRMRRASFCRSCGYDLRASIVRCPECGKPFSAPWRAEVSASSPWRDQARQP